jgi:hypothetical protein
VVMPCTAPYQLLLFSFINLTSSHLIKNRLIKLTTTNKEKNRYVVVKRPCKELHRCGHSLCAGVVAVLTSVLQA